MVAVTLNNVGMRPCGLDFNLWPDKDETCFIKWRTEHTDCICGSTEVSSCLSFTPHRINKAFKLVPHIVVFTAMKSPLLLLHTGGHRWNIFQDHLPEKQKRERKLLSEQSAAPRIILLVLQGLAAARPLTPVRDDLTWCSAEEGRGLSRRRSMCTPFCSVLWSRKTLCPVTCGSSVGWSLSKSKY